MKNKITLVMLTMLIIAGCSKDDKKKENESDLNTFSIGNIQYDINTDTSFGFYFESIGTNGFEMHKFQAGGNAIDDFNIGFGVCWQNTTNTVEGSFTKTSENLEAGWRFECSNVDISSNVVENLASGLLTVTPKGDSVYRVKFTGNTDNGTPFSFEFEQPIIIL